MPASAETRIDSIEVHANIANNTSKRNRTLWIVAALLVVLVAGISVVKVAASNNVSKTAVKEAAEKKAPVPVSVAAVETGTVSSCASIRPTGSG